VILNRESVKKTYCTSCN